MNTLPSDMIESILSRLPVKFLLRFKAISKEWNATISCPKFAEIQRQKFKNSKLFAWAGELGKLHVLELESDRFRLVSTIEYPPEKYLTYHIASYCDGLFLNKCGNLTYVLWNPSTRTYIKFQCPYPIDETELFILYGIGYDPLTQDYKVLLADMNHYAVFSCRNNKWSEMTEIPYESPTLYSPFWSGVTHNGTTYWILTFTKQPTKDAYNLRHEILSFDWTVEKFKSTLPVEDSYKINLAEDCKEGIHLLLYSSFDEVTMVKKLVGDDNMWLKYKVQLPVRLPRRHCSPQCLINENEILLLVEGGLELYNQTKKTFVDIQINVTTSSYPLPYQENLLLLSDKFVSTLD